MAETEIRARSLGKKKFSNREYSITIELFEHGMAYANIDDKLSYRRKGRTFVGSLLIFDDCTRECMYDYFDSLGYLKFDKVARRWFMRQLRHCTDGLLLPDGRADFKKVDARMYRNWQQTASRSRYCRDCDIKPLPADRLAKLLEMVPEAAYDENMAVAYIVEGGTGRIRRYYGDTFEMFVGKPDGFKLKLAEAVLPDFFEVAKRERTLDNCTVELEIRWMGPEECDLLVIVADNDSVRYTIC